MISEELFDAIIVLCGERTNQLKQEQRESRNLAETLRGQNARVSELDGALVDATRRIGIAQHESTELRSKLVAKDALMRALYDAKKDADVLAEKAAIKAIFEHVKELEDNQDPM